MNCSSLLITFTAQFIGFWRKLKVIHFDNKNQLLTRLNIVILNLTNPRLIFYYFNCCMVHLEYNHKREITRQ
jgi:hypothetical protein